MRDAIQWATALLLKINSIVQYTTHAYTLQLRRPFKVTVVYNIIIINSYNFKHLQVISMSFNITIMFGFSFDFIYFACTLYNSIMNMRLLFK